MKDADRRRPRRTGSKVHYASTVRDIKQLPKRAARRAAEEKYPHLLRGVEIVRANQVWAADITYIPTPTAESCARR